MKKEDKIIYRCKYCNKYYLHKGYAKRHEKYCKLNPVNQHMCFKFCKKLQRVYASQYGVNKQCVYFSCIHFKQWLYSYIAERKNLDIVMTGRRMPLQCRYYVGDYEKLIKHNDRFNFK